MFIFIIIDILIGDVICDIHEMLKIHFGLSMFLKETVYCFFLLLFNNKKNVYVIINWYIY